jgi:hypothetical protein
MIRLYPDLPARRARAIAADVACVVLVAVFAWVGMAVHDAIADLRSVGRGIADAGVAIGDSGRSAGGAIRNGFGTAAGAVDGVPIVGDSLSGALRDSGDAAGGEVERQAAVPERRVVAAGREAEAQTLRTANVVGWAIFLVPTVLLLARVGPQRVRQAMELTQAHRVLAGVAPRDPERVRALAERAAFGLPYGSLLRHTPDPIGDLLEHRHDRLLAALGEEAGLRLAPAPPRP